MTCRGAALACSNAQDTPSRAATVRPPPCSGLRLPSGVLGLLSAALGALAIASAAQAAAPGAPAAVSASVAPASSSTASPAVAAPPPTPDTAPADSPPQALAALAQLQNQVHATTDDGALATIGSQAASIETTANQAVKADRVQLTDLNRHRRASRASSAAPGQGAAPSRAALLAQLRSEEAVAAQAGKVFSLVAEQRREGFSARILTPTASPLSPEFWDSLAAAVGSDAGRLASLVIGAAGVAAEAQEPRAGLALGAGLALALALLAPIRLGLEKIGSVRRTRTSDDARFSKSAFAVWMTLINTAIPVLAVLTLKVSAQWGGLLSDQADQLAGALLVAVAWGAAILALGNALAADRSAERRVLGFSDAAAGRIGRRLVLVAVVSGAGFLLTRLNYIVGASVAATIAANSVVALAYVAVAAVVLVSSGRSRRQAAGDDVEAGSPAWTLVSLALSAAIVVTLGAVVGGFSTLASLIASQIFWLGLIAGASFLLLRFAEDLSAALFAQKGWARRSLMTLFGLRASTVAQIGLLAAAALQLTILAVAVSFALTPFGQDGRLLLTHLGGIGGAIRIGSAAISPKAVMSALAVVVLGFSAVNLVRSWVVRRYLPATNWDSGLRNSIGTGIGYLGVAITLLFAMGALGLGFQQIALIASALSVGIGFGLQQVVQNFVSGIILLVERPVKVGDWVNVGGVEGDIRRIRVRATEIQTFDRTTVIVPNSDLITKQVQNRTLGNPRARIELQLSIANPADAQRAADLVSGVAAANSAVLKDPGPAVYIDSMGAGGAVNFKAYAFVQNPRRMAAVRSELYFAVLEAFRGAGVAFMGAAGAQDVVIEPGPQLQRMIAALQPTPGAATRTGKGSRTR